MITKYGRLKRIEERTRKSLKESEQFDGMARTVQDIVVPAMAERFGVATEEYRAGRKISENGSVIDRLRALVSRTE